MTKIRCRPCYMTLCDTISESKPGHVGKNLALQPYRDFSQLDLENRFPYRTHASPYISSVLFLNTMIPANIAETKTSILNVVQATNHADAGQPSSS
jgi:hypothetical protein